MKNLFNIVIILIVLFLLSQSIISHFSHQKWKRFTFKDWEVLYEIAVKENHSSDFIKELYNWKETDFKDFLLSK